jgi:DNA recombination protein Rad52
MNWDDVTPHLAAKLDPKHVRKPPQGKYGEYIEGFHAINEANRIFGFGEWSYRIEYLSCVHKAQAGDKWTACYECSITVTVGGVTRQDVGYGSGFSKSLGDALESAGKEAATDALKRTLRTFGNPFGLALYDKSKANVGRPDPWGADGPNKAPLPGEAHASRTLPPPGPETGEIRAHPWQVELDPPHDPVAVPENNSAGSAIRDAWEDAIRDALPEGYTQRQFDEARSGALAAKLAGYKTAKGLDDCWAAYWQAIGELEQGAPDLHATLLAVKDNQRRMIEGAPPKQMLTKAVGEKIMLTIRLCENAEAVDAYRDEIGESDLAFALDHPKIKDAFDARRRVLSEPIILGDMRIG